MKFLINILYYFCLYKICGCWKSCKWHRCEKTVGVIKQNINKKKYILKMTICNIKLSLIKIKIKKIKMLTGFCQNWVLLSINSKLNFLYCILAAT